MSLITKVNGTVVFGVILLLSVHTAHARFLSIDPVQFDPNNPNPAMFNRYSYVENDPINGVDPFGLEKREIERVITGSRIPKSITVEAGDLTQGNLDSYFSDLPNAFFEKYNGSDFSGNSTEVGYLSSDGNIIGEGSLNGVSRNYRDVINVAQQIGRGISGLESDSSIGVYYSPTDKWYGLNFAPNKYAVSSSAAYQGALQLIATSIHERRHIHLGHYGLQPDPQRHQNVINFVNSQLVPLGFPVDTRCFIGARC